MHTPLSVLSNIATRLQAYRIGDPSPCLLLVVTMMKVLERLAAADKAAADAKAAEEWAICQDLFGDHSDDDL